MARRDPRPLLLLALALLGAGVSGCAADRAPVSTASVGRSLDCSQAVAAGAWRDVAVRCEEEFDATGDPRAGANAARAAFRLERPDDVRDWRRRLEGSERESYVAYLAGQSLGAVGRFDEAIAEFDHAIELYSAADATLGVGRSHYMLARVHWSRTDYRAAIEHAVSAWRIADDVGRTPHALDALGLIFSLLREIGDDTGAAWVLDEIERRDGGDDQRLSVEIAQYRAALHAAAGRPHDARRLHERSLSLIDGGQRDLRRGILLNLANVCLELGDVDAAAAHVGAAELELSDAARRLPSVPYYKSRVLAARGRDADARRVIERALRSDEIVDDWAWRLLHLDGVLAARGGHPGPARRSLDRSVAIVERLRTGMRLDSFRASMLQEKREPFEALFTLHLDQGRSLAALDVLQRSKARSILDTLVRVNDDDAAKSDETWDVESSLRRLTALERLIPAATSAPVSAAIDPEDLVAGVDDAIVFEYFRAGSRYWLARIGDGAVHFEPLGERVEIEALVGRLDEQPADVEAARRLGGLLLPVNLLPSAGSRLAIAPDAALTRLAFAALDVEGRPLITRHVLGIVPSASAMLVSMRSPVDDDGPPPVIIGDPRGDLPGAAAEARGVAARFGTVPLLGDAATLEALLRSRRPRLLHIASHAGLDEAGGWLMLADRRLHADEIVAHGLAPAVVVLVGCDTARAESGGLWGSVATAFFASGSSAVVATTRPIGDRAVLEFVERFYEAGGEREPLRALAAVQRSWIEDARPIGEWAPFLVFGVTADRGGH